MPRPITRSRAFTVISCLLLTTTNTHRTGVPILCRSTAFTPRPSPSRPTRSKNWSRKWNFIPSNLSKGLHEEEDENINNKNNPLAKSERRDQSAVLDRRRILQRSSMAVLSSLVGWSASSSVSHAYYDKAYPAELTMTDTNSEVDARERKINEIRRLEAERVARNNAAFTETPILDSLLWGVALWLLSGSRSNPIATPLANFIYKVDEEEWLRDRNEGLFANLPWEFLIILALVFAGLGWGTDALIMTLAEGDRTISLQLAGVCIIAGCSLELGRIASGQKKQTREESDRLEQLEQEFSIFANQRLKLGGNCHRSEVVAAFRRFYAKYRRPDSAEYPLTDLEVENLMRSYCRARGAKMSKAGFYVGIQINQDADAFVSRV